MHLIIKNIAPYLFCFLFCTLTQSQTIGLLYQTQDKSEGYTLFTPSSNNYVFLINNCGEVVNQWTFDEQPGLTCYLLENGNLLRAGKNYLETRDWSNNVVWSFNMQATGYKQHHDIEPLPNGNVLCLLRRNYTNTEIIAQGKDPNFIDANFAIDEIIELQPVGANNAIEVWKWSFLDHFIQDFDNTKLNYGTVANHPELIDLNFNNMTSDIMHLNSIDYNANLDQIMISARHMNEIYIIDHSTSTIEASGHTGGNYGKGGDLLWRWGNPEAYRQGSSADQKLFLQHDARWVENDYIDEGKITVFNNGGSSGNFSESSIHIISPEIISEEYQMESFQFKPLNFEWSWQGDILGITVLEGRKSGTHSLPNGNMMICETGEGRISEIRKDGTLVWSYKNPTGVGTTIYNQNETSTNSNTMFRGDKYPTNYPGFIGKDLTPTGIIENQNSVSENCINQLSTTEHVFEEISIINPIQNNFLQFNKIVQLDAVTVYDLNGRQITKHSNINSNRLEINLPPSIYIIKLEKESYSEFVKIIKQ